MSGYQARAGRIGLSVDNFFTEKILNDFKAQMVKSLESIVFDHFEFLNTFGLARDQFKLQWLN